MVDNNVEKFVKVEIGWAESDVDDAAANVSACRGHAEIAN